MLIRRAVCCLAAVISLAAPDRAAACDHCRSESTDTDKLGWPDDLWRVHFSASAAIGVCIRVNDALQLTYACGDVVLGIDMPIPKTRFRIMPELGFGATGQVTTGDASIGISASAGGPAFVSRVLFGIDFNRVFFARVGPELDIGAGVNIGGVADLGSRLLNHLELGLRGRIIADGVTTSGSSSMPWFVPDYGVLFFARGFL